MKTKRFRVLVCGDRLWQRPIIIKRELRRMPLGTIVIHGGCRGADLQADDIACHFGFGRLVFPVDQYDWTKLGKAAGPIRNAKMLKEGKPDLVLAFHRDIAKSKGTLDMIKQANKAGIEVRLFSC